MRIWLHRLLSLFRGRRLDEELEAELRTHLEMSVEENLSRGMSLNEAWQAARRSFGGVEQVKEVYREGRGLPWIEGLFQDLRYGLRQLRKSPGVTATVVVSIALGIGANTTVFSIVNGTLLGTLPVREPSRLVSLSEGESTSSPDYVAYRDQTNAFEGLSAHFPFIPASLGGAEPERVWGQVVTANYFDVLGLPMAQGRGFVPEESREYGPKAVTVISDSLWKRRFDADPGIVGKPAILNNRAYTVVGVAPPDFSGEDRGFVSEFWVPISMLVEIMPGWREERFAERNHQWLMLSGRLRPGVSLRQAEAELNVIKDRIETQNNQPREDRDPPIRLTAAGGLNGAVSGFARALMAVLMAVVALVLLIACANVANVLLARAVDRRREIGVRLAIGAGRRRVLRQLLTESLVLAAAGAILGVAVSFVATRVISLAQLPFPIPIRLDFAPDLRVLCFAALVTVVTALLFGTVPALKATKFDLVATLKGNIDGWRKFRRFGLTNSLVVLQVALSIVLLASAGLFLRSLQKAASADIGMRSEGIVLLGFDPKLHAYSEEQTRQFLIGLRQRVEALPAVERLSFIDVVPLSLGGSRSGFSPGREPGERRQAADVYAVDAEYFETMGVALIRGRGFSITSDLSRDVAVLNETLAERLFPGEDPLGKLVTGRGTTYEVVGIARNSRSRMIVEEQQPIIYHYMLRKPDDRTGQIGITIAVKTRGEPYSLVQAIREQIQSLDPNLAVFNIETMDEHVTKALLIPRLSAILLSAFGVIGVTLAAIGLYGVVGYSVKRRTREIGIRMALGADAARVTRSIMTQGFCLAAVGMIFGLPAALALSSLYGAFLYGIAPTDPYTFLAVGLVLLLIAVVASLGPARRAAKVQPMAAVRYE